jgi:hypothetical protein
MDPPVAACSADFEPRTDVSAWHEATATLALRIAIADIVAVAVAVAVAVDIDELNTIGPHVRSGDVARESVNTPQHEQSRRDRKKVEMPFATQAHPQARQIAAPML